MSAQALAPVRIFRGGVVPFGVPPQREAGHIRRKAPRLRVGKVTPVLRSLLQGGSTTGVTPLFLSAVRKLRHLDHERKPRPAERSHHSPAASRGEHDPTRDEAAVAVAACLRDVRAEPTGSIQPTSRDHEPAAEAAPPPELERDRSVCLDRCHRPAVRQCARLQEPTWPVQLSAKSVAAVVEVPGPELGAVCLPPRRRHRDGTRFRRVC